jgi:hypothetical protein
MPLLILRERIKRSADQAMGNGCIAGTANKGTVKTIPIKNTGADDHELVFFN